MAWTFTGDVDHLAARAEPVLAADPTRFSLALTTLDAIRGGRRYAAPPLVGLYEEDGAVTGIVIRTPPHDLHLTLVPEAALAPLVTALTEREPDLPGAQGDVELADAFAAAWTAAAGPRATVLMEMTLHVLGRLVRPDPMPSGRGRVATADDVALGLRWFEEFAAHADLSFPVDEASLRARIAERRLWFWDDPVGRSVAMAGRTPAVATVARIAPVYTPPEHRRHGYAGAITHACTAAARRARGVGGMVLYADKANAQANNIYRRLGYAPVRDIRIVRFG